MIGSLLLVVFAPLIVTTLVFIAETALGAMPARGSPAPIAAYDASRVVVLVPAHDEEQGIAAILQQQRAAMPPGMRLLVVADNCTDRTAERARAAGAEVVERHDATLRGKGHALDFGRTWLAATPPDCVIVVDADTVPAGDSLARLAARALAERRPIQAAYHMIPDATASSVARFSAVAFFVKNVVRGLGAARLGAPTMLSGSGMAFPWPIFATLPLATGHVAEDLMLGVHCSVAGVAPRFEPAASITGGTSSDRGTAVQRKRWESGFFQVAQDSALPLIAQGVRRGRPGLVWLGLELATPPLILLLTLDAVAVAIAGLAWLLGASAAPFWVMTILPTVAVLAIVGALAGHRRLDMLRDWTAIPRYLVWKLGLTIRTLVRREHRWIRTDRD